MCLGSFTSDTYVPLHGGAIRHRNATHNHHIWCEKPVCGPFHSTIVNSLSSFQDLLVVVGSILKS